MRALACIFVPPENDAVIRRQKNWENLDVAVAIS
jgi:hypothetical protein